MDIRFHQRNYLDEFGLARPQTHAKRNTLAFAELTNALMEKFL